MQRGIQPSEMTCPDNTTGQLSSSSETELQSPPATAQQLPLLGSKKRARTEIVMQVLRDKIPKKMLFLLGVFLGIPDGELQLFEADELGIQGPFSDPTTSLVAKWLKGPGEASWEILVEALHDIEYHTLELEVTERHCTGNCTLPVTLPMTTILERDCPAARLRKSSSVDTSLSLRNLTRVLSRFPKMWFPLGVELWVPMGTLHSIEDRHSDILRRGIGMLLHLFCAEELFFSRELDDQVGWEVFAKALESIGGKCKDLAEAVRAKYIERGSSAAVIPRGFTPVNSSHTYENRRMGLFVRNMARVIRGTPITGSDLGAALSLNKYHFSSEMLKSYANDPERYRFEVLHDWLVRDPNSSWERFAKALNQIGHRELANDVLAKYLPESHIELPVVSSNQPTTDDCRLGSQDSKDMSDIQGFSEIQICEGDMSSYLEGTHWQKLKMLGGGGFCEGDMSSYLEGTHWKKLKMLGGGGFCKCYLARDTQDGTIFAVKQVCYTCNTPSEQEEALRILEDEVNIQQRLKHPNIVKCLGAAHHSETNLFNIFVEWIPAGSLDQHLDKVGAFAELTVSNYTYQIICGVAYLHENRIIHRDLKGANVLVDQTGKRVLIADFGTAGTMKSSKTMTGFKDTKGTIPFMAPEVIKPGGYGRKCDIWSIGCVIIQMATAKLPWEEKYDVAEPCALLFVIGSATEPPPIPTFESPLLKDLTVQCLKINPDDRPTAAELLKHPLFTS